MRASKTRLTAVLLTVGICPSGGSISAQAQVCLLYERQKLTAADPIADQRFGGSVSIVDDWAIVGAYRDDDACPGDPECCSGSAYLFRRDDNGTPQESGDDHWVQHVKLTASDAAALDAFGVSVSITNDRAVVGADGDDGYTGAAYVFRRQDNGTAADPSDDLWIEEDKLIAGAAEAGDEFGSSVSISGDRVVAGAQRDSDAGLSSGSAYVFRRDDNGTPSDPGDDFWVQEAKLTAADAEVYHYFGRSVSVSAGRIVVGVSTDDDAGPNAGAVYVFRHDDNGTPSDPNDDDWVQEVKLTATDADPGDHFGTSVSISGGRMVVGAHFDADAGDFAGSAYVSRHDDNGTPTDPADDFWIQEAKLVASDAAAEDVFGNSVSIAGDRVVVGAYGDDDRGDFSGSAYVFQRDNNGTPSDPNDDYWVQEVKLIAADGAAEDLLGSSVSISENWVLVGSPGDDRSVHNAGSAYASALDKECQPIPAVSEWGVIVLGLLVLTAGTLVHRHRVQPTA